MNKRKAIVSSFALIIVFLIIFFTFPRKNANHAPENIGVTSDELPKNQNFENPEGQPASEEKIAETPELEKNVPLEAPEKFLLDIPFYSQAPLSKWDAFHEDMCEEASVLNAGLYLEEKKLTKDQFEAELQKMQNVEKKGIGEWKSTTIAQTKKLVDIYFEGKVKSKIIENPAIDEIEAEIAAGRPVVVPLAGREIGNPNFTPPGPVYHMLVIKGYDPQNFITNDVGTRKGNSYTYKKEVIMKNIHDWNEKDIHLGGKRVLVLIKL
ncbi:MAG: hypothetical protein A3J76_01555 [Candidatus Moranbacteria bacterium RBG_13_45_13]|nr:MAG: hypothetical protein A3J76_01555 [Candidatus Moranbacteria bacterium RBG_13_45_13]